MMSDAGEQQGFVRHCGLLAAAALGLWLLAAGPAWWLAGADGLLGLTVAGLLCWIPGCLALVAASVFRGASSALVVGAGGMRMLFVLAGVLAMRAGWPRLGFKEFVVWLLPFYVVMLLVETLLIVRRPVGGSSPDSAAAAR